MDLITTTPRLVELYPNIVISHFKRRADTMLGDVIAEDDVIRHESSKPRGKSLSHALVALTRDAPMRK